MNSVVVMVGVLITLVTGIPVMLQILHHHPRGLFVLFFTEMWERFSYYGMRGLLVFYLTQQLLFTDSAAAAQYGSYATLVYLLPLVGGVLADRYLGARKAVAFGALLLVAGHATMAIEAPAAHQSLIYHGARYEFRSTGAGDARKSTIEVGRRSYAYSQTPTGEFRVAGLPSGAALPASLPKGAFSLETQAAPPLFTNILYLALALIVMGVGFLKSNISAIVGQLYEQGDPRRDPGFTLFYYGVNLGAFWAAILCGYLGQRLGWSYGFGLAGVGMLAGYLTFRLGKPLLQGKGEPPDAARLARPAVGPLNLEWTIYLGALIGLALLWFVVQRNGLVGIALGVGAVAALAYVGRYMATKCGKVERERLFLAFVLIFGSVVFFTLFEQAATSLNLFADRNTNLHLIGHPIRFSVLGRQVFMGTAEAFKSSGAPGALWIDMGLNAAQTQSFNAGFILIFAPLFAAIWSWLGRRGWDPGPLVKFGLGLAQVGLGFLVIVWSQGLADAHFRVPLMVLGFTYLLHTTGELFLSPVGLSEITKLAPPVLISTMLAIWFIATAAAEYIGAIIAQVAGTATAGGQVLDPAAGLRSAIQVFQIIGWTGVGFGVLFLALAPVLGKWAHGVDDAANHPAPTR
jgi:POT family proton-dependent oligopeptide transporter